MKVLTVFGTRPEAIKMCPLVYKLKEATGINSVVCLTGQHKEMLSQVMNAFDIQEDYNLEVMREKQTLTDITISIMETIGPIIYSEKPDIVLVHGDTTTSYATAMAAFYQKIPVGHVEAGLRTGNIYSPYPEEMNRLLTDRISTFLFAPTELNKNNLFGEGIAKNVFITGNTVIDSFQYTVRPDYVFENSILSQLEYDKYRIVILTAHRRENIGEPLKNICNAVKRIALEYPEALFVYPVHLNPMVRETAYSILSNSRNTILLDPISVLDMHNLLARSYFVMTDSGGLQEEAPHFGKPVLVLRTETERPEAVEAGTAKVIGIEEDMIYSEAKLLLDRADEYDKMAKAINPYGDGHASERIVQALLECFGKRDLQENDL